jgi:hypothetical protein
MNDDGSDYRGSIIIAIVALAAVGVVLAVAGLCGAGILYVLLAA